MPFQFQVAVPPFIDHPTMSQILTTLGLTTNLRLVLDASDAASYTSGQSWLDRSGNGYDFFRGADGSATASDPTFNGIAGGRTSSEYWSFDGGDYFTYDSANESWMSNYNKNNATGTIIAWLYTGAASSPTAGDAIASTLPRNLGITEYGFTFRMVLTSGAGALEMVAESGTVANGILKTSIITLSASAWQMVAVSFNEASNSCVFAIGKASGFASESTTYTFGSTAANDAGNTLHIASDALAAQVFASGRRLASVVMWEGTALSAANLEAIFTATRGKFGI
jgi:hypothetical protein